MEQGQGGQDQDGAGLGRRWVRTELDLDRAGLGRSTGRTPRRELKGHKVDFRVGRRESLLRDGGNPDKQTVNRQIERQIDITQIDSRWIDEKQIDSKKMSEEGRWIDGR